MCCKLRQNISKSICLVAFLDQLLILKQILMEDCFVNIICAFVCSNVTSVLIEISFLFNSHCKAINVMVFNMEVCIE